ncbi:MAG: hypothetical protein SNJ74_12995, partial [Fimbriimonadaceae bacterium]
MKLRTGFGIVSWVAAGWVLLGIGLGCGSASAPEASAANGAVASGDPEPPEDPEYVQLRAALFQIRSAIDLVQEAYAAAKSAQERPGLPADKRAALEDAVAYLDSAGATLAEQGDAPPDIG